MRIDEIVRKFQEDFPRLVSKMRDSQHHWTTGDTAISENSKFIKIPILIERPNPHHLEGDIFCHTMMVCQEAQRRGFSDLLKYCALLHDIGKPDCRGRNPEKKYINFFGHEPFGAFLAIDILKHYGFSKDEIIHAFQLIAMHTEPFKLGSKLYDRMIGNQKLYTDLIELSQADANGRFSDAPKNNVDPITLIPVRQPELHLGLSKIVILIGLPGSGKTTIRNELLASGDDYEVLSSDDIIMEIGKGETYNEKFNSVKGRDVDGILDKRFRKAVSDGKNIIVDRTNLSRKSRKRFLGQVPKEYEKKAIVCLTGQKELAKRNEERETEGKYIGTDVFHRMMKQFYSPLFDEFNLIEWRLE